MARTVTVTRDRTTDEDRYGARAAGGLYLVVIAAGLFAEFFVRSALIVPRNPTATATNILASESLFRAGLLADLVAAGAYLGVALLLFRLFRPAARYLATFSLVLGASGSAAMAANLVHLFAPLALLRLPATAPVVEILQYQAYGSLRLHALGYNISALFFGGYLFAIGILAVRTRLLPRWTGWLLVVAGPAWLLYIVTAILSPTLSAYLFPLVPLLSLVAEGALALRLVIGGRTERDQRA